MTRTERALAAIVKALQPVKDEIDAKERLRSLSFKVSFGDNGVVHDVEVEPRWKTLC